MTRFFGAILLLTVAVPVAAQVKNPEQIFQEVSRSIVTIHALGGDGNVSNIGSGVVAIEPSAANPICGGSSE